MSKKSRKRNKKILAALALAGGAAMLGRRGKGAVTGVPLNPNLQKTIAADAGSDIAAEVAANTGSDFQTKYKRKVNGNWITPGTSGVMDRVTGVSHPILGQSTARPNRFGTLYKGGGIAKRGTGVALKKGGRVTGIAKRGFGRALMKGKK